MGKPTEDAERFFDQAQGVLVRGMLDEKGATALSAEFAGQINAMQGLVHLSVRLRATCLLLEEVKSPLFRQASGRP
jgi:hypothetical protein